MNEGWEKKEEDREEGLYQGRVYKLGADGRYRATNTSGCRSRQGKVERRWEFAENGLANLWNVASSPEVGDLSDWWLQERNGAATTRERALENFCPVKIFSPRETERSPSETSREDEERSHGRKTEMSIAAVKTSKSRRTRVCRGEIYGLSLERSRFIGRTERGVVEERFLSKTKLHARRKHIAMLRGAGKKTALLT